MREVSFLYHESKIKKLHVQRIQYPDNETLKNQLEYQLYAWAPKVPVKILVASNERLPWSSSEIGYVTGVMPSKKECGIAQVGDYMAFLEPYEAFCITLIERKGGIKKEMSKTTGGASDLYASLMNSKRRARFLREHKRFLADPRFQKGKGKMILVAECSLEDFLRYIPAFHGKKRNIKHVGAAVNARLGTIAALYERGIPVLFAGNRKRATDLYYRLIQQDLIKNYWIYLGLDPIKEDIEDEDELEEEDMDFDDIEEGDAE